VKALARGMAGGHRAAWQSGGAGRNEFDLLGHWPSRRGREAPIYKTL
jgi:hypothetical protein